MLKGPDKNVPDSLIHFIWSLLDTDFWGKNPLKCTPYKTGTFILENSLKINNMRKEAWSRSPAFKASQSLLYKKDKYIYIFFCIHGKMWPSERFYFQHQLWYINLTVNADGTLSVFQLTGGHDGHSTRFSQSMSHPQLSPPALGSDQKNETAGTSDRNDLPPKDVWLHP